MIQKSAIIRIRKRLGIPEKGFQSDNRALAWYKKHYSQAKGKHFRGTLGFQYDRKSGYIDFKYDIGQNFLKIYTAPTLDNTVPLDREAIILAEENKIPEWAAAWLRLVILLGEPPETLKVQIPEYLITPVGNLRVLVHPPNMLSLRKWRKTGTMMGLLPGEIDLWKVPGATTIHASKRENRTELLYWQTYQAYMEAIEERRLMGQPGKKGLLQDTARILVENYGWPYEEKSYTIRRYLDRAEMIWRVSTHFEDL
jgi:hypothetical protein